MYSCSDSYVGPPRFEATSVPWEEDEARQAAQRLLVSAGHDPVPDRPSGAVGRSVYQKLRELKHLHEVAWTDEFRRKRPEEFTVDDKKKIAEEKAKGNDYKPIRSKEERGIALNAQKTNAIADMAVVLAGQGAGNKMLAGEAEEGERQLVEVSVSWSNDQDKQYSEVWSKNVTHGLFEKPVYASGLESEPEPAEQPVKAMA